MGRCSILSNLFFNQIDYLDYVISAAAMDHTACETITLLQIEFLNRIISGSLKLTGFQDYVT